MYRCSFCLVGVWGLIQFQSIQDDLVIFHQAPNPRKKNKLKSQDKLAGILHNWNHTPPKTNMEPENGPLEKEIPIGNHHLQVPC